MPSQIVITQTPAAATNFDGTAGQGLVTFTATGQLVLPPNDDAVIVVTGVVLENRNLELLATVDCFFKPTAEALTTTVRITVFNGTSVSGFSKMGCRIPVPRDSNTGTTPWQLILVTTGTKTQTASFSVQAHVQRMGLQ